VPIASLNPAIKSVRPRGTNLLVKRIEESEMVGSLYMPEQRMRIGLGRFTVIAVAAKVTEEHGIKEGDVIYAPHVLGYQRVEVEGHGLCHFIPCESVAAVETP
jgi:co-chaperonin GroES (HSP10)